MTTPRVLLASTSLKAGNGGIARVGRMSLKALLESDCDVGALSLLDGDDAREFGELVWTAGGRKCRFLANHLAMLSQYDVALYDHVGLARGRQWHWHARRRPYAVWIHGNEVWENLRREHRDIIRDAKLVLVNSRSTLDRYTALHGPLPQARVCHLATEYDLRGEPSGSLHYASSPPTVLVVGRAEADQPGKGHRELIDCWPDVVARVPEARLLIVGRGSGMNALKARAAQSPVAQQIRFLGFIEEREIEKVWRQADVFAMPSRQEGFGIVYVEAMARRKAIVASIHDAGQEINIDGVTGFNVALDDPRQMVDRITRLLLHRDLRDEMGRAGCVRWKRHFQYECFKKRFLEALASVFEVDAEVRGG